MTDEASELPQGHMLTAIDETFRDNPYRVLEQVQAQTAVLHDEVLKRYVYTRHDDVKTILRDKDLWSDPRKANPGTFSAQFLGGGEPDQEPSMLLMDEPGHRRLRGLVSSSFTPAAVERWRPRVRATVTKVLDAINDDEFDLIERFAGPIPTVVIADMLGIDPGMHGSFKAWSDASVKIAFNPFCTQEELTAGHAAQTALNGFFASEIATRRETLGDDLISDMINAEGEAAGERLTEAEMMAQCNLLLVAGNVTTTDLIGNGIKALLDFPEQLEKLRDDPGLIENAVEEMLRYDSPVINSGRIANRDVNFGHCPVHKGESLSTSLAAANHDPAIYPQPHTFDIEREDTHHQSFGGGRHLCLGAHLARLEAQEAILGLIGRYPHLRASDRGYRYAAVPSFRGMAEFWISTAER